MTRKTIILNNGPAFVTLAALGLPAAAFADSTAADDSDTTLAGYTLVDVRAECELASALTVFGRVENVGNVQYQTAYGYNGLGRTAYLGVRGHF
jgi:vitamin B12 transporter